MRQDGAGGMESNVIGRVQRSGVTLVSSAICVLAILVGLSHLEASAQSEVRLDTGASFYERGMELWRAGQTGQALQHLMTATRDPEVSLYAARQVALMGRFALPVLYQGLWHREEIIQSESAIILGWIGDRDAVEPLLLRMRYFDAPLEAEYALRKIGSLTGEQILSILEGRELSNSVLLDRKVGSVVRLARMLRVPVDSVPLLDLVDAMEMTKASELAEQPFGHLVSARLNLLLFLAERKVGRAAPAMVKALRPGSEEANLALAEALIELGAPSLEPLARRFQSAQDPSFRALVAVTHYLASGALDVSASGPASILLNEALESPTLAAEVAALTVRFSEALNPLLAWFTHHSDPRVRKALVPRNLTAQEARSRPWLKSFFLEKTRDSDQVVAAAHIRFVASYLPDSEVEMRLDLILRSSDEAALLREAALEAAVQHGLVHLLLRLLESPGEPLRRRAIELAADRTEPEVVSSILAILREPEGGDVKRAAIRVAAELWKRPEAKGPLLELLRMGGPLWLEAARGLAASCAVEAAEPFLALVDAGRKIDPDEASGMYFAFTGIPTELTGNGPGSFRFDALDLRGRPPRDKVLVVLSERTDYQGWIKVEERWEGERQFRLDEGREELVLYDKDLHDRVVAGAGIILLEDTVRQTVLNPLDVSELRRQTVNLIEELPEFPLAGLDGDELRLIHRGRWVNLPLGKDLREETERAGWGRSALVPLRLFDRERIVLAPTPPPSGWLRGEPQPLPRAPRQK